MPSLESIILVTIAGLTLSLSPGPSMFYVFSRSVGQSRAAGFASALGLAIGGVALALATASGLAVAFSYFTSLRWLIQFAGGTYLIYLGLQMFSGPGETGNNTQFIKHQSMHSVIAQGIVVEVLNPKTVLFFIAFLPQFIDPDRGSIPLQMLVLGTLIPITALPSDILVSLLGGTLSGRVAKNQKLATSLRWLASLFLVGLGIRAFSLYFE